MNTEICLKKLGYVGVLNFATVDSSGDPQIRNISAIHFEADALYFFTARGKEFCKQLFRDGRVQISGYTMYKESIRLSGRAVPVPDDEQEKWINTIFSEQPYLENVYPGDTRKIGIVFCIRGFSIEYFNLGVNPIFRETYEVGGVNAEKRDMRLQTPVSAAENAPVYVRRTRWKREIRNRFVLFRSTVFTAETVTKTVL